MIRLLFLTVSLIFSGASIAASCVKTGSTCVDSTPCKTVSGVQVCLTDPEINKTCWQYDDTYNCIKPNSVDYCKGVSQVRGCWQTDSVCAVPGPTPTAPCDTWRNTYRCGSPNLPVPTTTTIINSSHTLVADTAIHPVCATHVDNPTCSIISHKLVNNGSPTGAWQDEYTCMSAPATSCSDLLVRGCTMVGARRCITTNPNTNACTLFEKTYRCIRTPASTSTVADCASNRYCTGGNCFNTGHVPDADMAQTAAMMEAMRQAGNYMDGSMKIFSGTSDQCTKTLFGLFNCCKPSGGAGGMNNSSIMNSAMSAGGQALASGSGYMYDMMFDNSTVMKGIYSALGASHAVTAPFSPSFSMYGFTASWSASGGFVLTFDPTTLAIQVAIMIITEIATCDPPEKMLALKKGQNLCRYTGSFCSVEIPIVGICLQKTETYCCFNSRLAKIVNAGGKTQLGQPLTDCTGFTTEQFSLIDFSQIDMSEFIAEIMANVHMPNTNAINTDSTATMQRKLNNYYTRGRQ